MECWNNGIMGTTRKSLEYWNNGVMGKKEKNKTAFVL